MDIEWLRDTSIEPSRFDQSHWATRKGITSTDWSLDSEYLLHLDTRRINLLGNCIDRNFSRASMMVFAK